MKMNESQSRTKGRSSKYEYGRKTRIYERKLNKKRTREGTMKMKKWMISRERM